MRKLYKFRSPNTDFTFQVAYWSVKKLIMEMKAHKNYDSLKYYLAFVKSECHQSPNWSGRELGTVFVERINQLLGPQEGSYKNLVKMEIKNKQSKNEAMAAVRALGRHLALNPEKFNPYPLFRRESVPDVVEYNIGRQDFQAMDDLFYTQVLNDVIAADPKLSKLDVLDKEAITSRAYDQDITDSLPLKVNLSSVDYNEFCQLLVQRLTVGGYIPQPESMDLVDQDGGQKGSIDQSTIQYCNDELDSFDQLSLEGLNMAYKDSQLYQKCQRCHNQNNSKVALQLHSDLNTREDLQRLLIQLETGIDHITHKSLGEAVIERIKMENGIKGKMPPGKILEESEKIEVEKLIQLLKTNGRRILQQ